MVLRWLSLFIVFVCIAETPLLAQRKKQKQDPGLATIERLDLRLEENPVFRKAFTGFALFDPDSRRMLYEYNSDKYFSPASNTKILTLFTALNILGDSVPALRYVRQGDLTIFWGTGDPSFLNPHLVQNPAVFEFLRHAPGHLLFCPANFRDRRYGKGWMWSDYPYYYQAEKSPFPIYSNVAHFRLSEESGQVLVEPRFLAEHLTQMPGLDEEDLFGRLEHENVFTYNPAAVKGDQLEAHVPFHYTPEFLAQLLTDTLGRRVAVLPVDLLPPPDAATVYSVHVDSLYRLMMQESDNFVAEQLLLLCSNEIFNQQNSELLIRYISDRLLATLPDEPQWVDGSGLSRYNLITPRDLVDVLDRIMAMVPRERLLGIFPAGGISGTIKNNYKNGIQPYVFAKTGTLRNNHCLSGYLLTRSGRLLIFSFMHNNFRGSTSAYKREMEQVLQQIRHTIR